jgi:hypothetical protein
MPKRPSYRTLHAPFRASPGGQKLLSRSGMQLPLDWPNGQDGAGVGEPPAGTDTHPAQSNAAAINAQAVFIIDPLRVTRPACIVLQRLDAIASSVFAQYIQREPIGLCALMSCAA